MAYYADFWDSSAIYTHANVAGYGHDVWAWGVGTDVLGPVRLMGGYIHYTAEQANVGDRDDDVFTIGAKYRASPKWLYLIDYYNIQTHNAGGGTISSPFADTSGFAKKSNVNGRRSTIYGATFYNWDRVTTLYLAGDYQMKGGGGRQTLKFSNNNMPSATTLDGYELGVGMNYKF